jgi:type I restriction enzyme R subunit
MPKAAPANSEWLTRKQLIDRKLREAGWEITPFKSGRSLSNWQNCAIEEFETDNGPADYALCRNGKVLGVVEAKKLSLGPQNALVQAERYAKGIPQAGMGWGAFGVPFLYSTNGEVIWYHDVRDPLNTSREIAGFHTPTALDEFLNHDLDAARERLRASPNNQPLLRPYQRDANEGIERAIGNRKRTMLVAMATGTGKTFTIVNEIYRLMKAEVARRVLFLVDRRALAAQAVRAFASFEAEPGLKFDKIYEVYSQRFQREDFGEDEKFDPKTLADHYLMNPKPGSAFVYVSTIQRTTINLFGKEAAFGGEEGEDEDAAQVPIPIHAFDLIVADECHRGYTSSQTAIWRRTLDHFDAIKIGLTATPAAHTTSLFQEVVARYDYEQAVAEGHLVDYDVVTIKSNVRVNGIFLNEGEEINVVNPDTGARKLDYLEDERQFDTSQIERDITSPDSNRKILEEIKKYALEHEQQHGRFPKTLIFAVNDLPHTSHADQLVNTARQIFGRGDSFVRKITGSASVDRPLQYIREFRNRPQPGIVVTVDMLTTGVDIPDLEFIVFLRPVKSRILFTQMMGRGTRKGERFTDKSHFVVFDCFDGTLLAYFRNTTDIAEDPPTGPTRSIPEIISDIWTNRDRDYNIRVLVKRLQRIDKEMSGKAREEFAAFIPDGDMAAYARELPRRIRQDFTTTLALLRNTSFQDLLMNYERKQRVFLVTEGTQDVVSSEWLVRGADGKEYKPADYLQAFAEFVRTHESDIEAIGALLKRPRRWTPGALQELRDKLAAAPQRFTVDNLQRAHAIRDKKAMVDIISMVKHAADEHLPLFNAAERVDLAFTRLTRGREFTPEQQQWIDRIRAHMQENLSLSSEDFDDQPALARLGGLGRASKVFGGQLPGLIEQINLEVAA